MRMSSGKLICWRLGSQIMALLVMAELCEWGLDGGSRLLGAYPQRKYRDSNPFLFHCLFLSCHEVSNYMFSTMKFYLNTGPKQLYQVNTQAKLYVFSLKLISPRNSVMGIERWLVHIFFSHSSSSKCGICSFHLWHISAVMTFQMFNNKMWLVTTIIIVITLVNRGLRKLYKHLGWTSLGRKIIELWLKCSRLALW